VSELIDRSQGHEAISVRVAPEPTAAQSLETSAIHRRGRNGRHFPLPKGFSCDGALKCVPGNRHGRHGENGLDKRFFQHHDAHDDESRRFSWQRRLACLKGEETEGDSAIIATRHHRVPTASPAPKAMRLSDCQSLIAKRALGTVPPVYSQTHLHRPPSQVPTADRQTETRRATGNFPLWWSSRSVRARFRRVPVAAPRGGAYGGDARQMR
jgi:hypothetical protein